MKIYSIIKVIFYIYNFFFLRKLLTVKIIYLFHFARIIFNNVKLTIFFYKIFIIRTFLT